MEIKAKLNTNHIFAISMISDLSGQVISIGEEGRIFWMHESCAHDEISVILDPNDNSVMVNFNLPDWLYWSITGWCNAHELSCEEFGSFKNLESDNDHAN